METRVFTAEQLFRLMQDAAMQRVDPDANTISMEDLMNAKNELERNDSPFKLSTFELQILRECSGELPRSDWGAAVGEAIGYLRGSGYVDNFHNVTAQGFRALAQYAEVVR